MTDADIDAALERRRLARSHEPSAETVRYDRQLDRMVVQLTNGCTFAFPPRLTQGLQAATVEQLSQAEVLGTGSGLHWKDLDVDLSVPDLMAGLFGTRAYLAGQAGRATSSAKAAAARADGGQGGRPRKSV